MVVFIKSSCNYEEDIFDKLLKFYNLKDITVCTNDVSIKEQADKVDSVKSMLMSSNDIWFNFKNNSLPDFKFIQLNNGLEVVIDGFEQFYFKTENNFQVYVDMDGVVSDFEKGVSKLPVSESNGSSPWKAIYKSLDSLHTNFFLNLEVLPFSEKILEASKKCNPIFLSSTGNYNHIRIAAFKQQWIRDHFPNYKVITVPTSKLKGLYAASNSLLIDDRMKSIKAFANNKGLTILHTSVEETLENLSKLL